MIDSGRIEMMAYSSELHFFITVLHSASLVASALAPRGPVGMQGPHATPPAFLEFGYCSDMPMQKDFDPEKVY